VATRWTLRYRSENRSSRKSLEGTAKENAERQTVGSDEAADCVW
jgi:hypothetical protein